LVIFLIKERRLLLHRERISREFLSLEKTEKTPEFTPTEF